MTDLIAIVGPTGVGKTSLALQLTQALDGEIISADSRQIYRHMDIGTAKPTPEELSLVPHHLIDVLDPDEPFSLAEFQERAYAAIEDVLSRDRLPFLVGGTGQYVRAVIEGWKIPRVPPDEDLRARLYDEEEKKEGSLYDRLIALDPAAEDLVDRRNVRRVVRALEVCLKSGHPFSEQRGKSPPPYRIVQIGLTMEREALYERIDARIEDMVARGLVQEVQGLLDLGYTWDLPAMSSLGYVQLKDYLSSSGTLEDGIASIKKETRRFIRQQYNWFRLTDARILWLDATQAPYQAALAYLQEGKR